MDGNRRWARQMGLASPSLGHQYGAEHVEDVLHWCDRAGIKHVTVFVCSAENLQRRGDAEIAFLMKVVEEVLADRLSRPGATWQVHVAGALDVLPDPDLVIRTSGELRSSNFLVWPVNSEAIT